MTGVIGVSSAKTARVPTVEASAIKHMNHNFLILSSRLMAAIHRRISDAF
jgi:hypothetical protein